MKAVFIGLGHIGLPTAAVLASKGFQVICVDVNHELVNAFNLGKIYIPDPDLEKMIREAVDSGNLKASVTPEPADVFFIAVPFKTTRRTGISSVEFAMCMALPFLRPGNLLIIKSTSPVKTTERIAALIYKKRPELKDQIYIAYCTERIMPGNILFVLEQSDRVIGGVNPESAEKAAEFYSYFIKGELYKTDTRTAERYKLGENTYRHKQRIAFTGKLSVSWNDNDRPQADLCVSRVLAACGEFTHRTGTWPIVACMGLTYKPDTDDVRESFAMNVTSRLIVNAQFDVLAVEPNIKSHK
ncbi:MAG: UDP-N-acetyl-D-mannosamine dehydrogenase, partial [Treponema sp.]|nr:UDP-N-acetyl-D-mannosamine dehydrogenase [Treponema sp.]